MIDIERAPFSCLLLLVNCTRVGGIARPELSTAECAEKKKVNLNIIFFLVRESRGVDGSEGTRWRAMDVARSNELNNSLCSDA